VDADWFEFAVMHHTDCGSGFLADDDLRHGFAARGFDDAELAALAVLDPAVTVPYDVKTGLVTTVVPARSRQPD
jgi:carbonic anhydrase